MVPVSLEDIANNDQLVQDKKGRWSQRGWQNIGCFIEYFKELAKHGDVIPMPVGKHI